ncbi:hypothetical protein FQZ97_1253300 [compost metagenome]
MLHLGLVQRQSFGAEAEVAARIVRRIGHQPDVREHGAGLETRHALGLENEAGHIDIAREHPEHVAQQRQRA